MTRAGWFILLAALALLVFTGCNRLPTLPNALADVPRAVITVTPRQGPVPLDVLVDSGASRDLDGEIVLRELAIDDEPFYEIDVTHQLRLVSEGSHRLTLRVTDDDGEIGVAETTVVAGPAGGSVSGFRISVLYPAGRVSTRDKQAFEAAATKWSAVVIGDLPDATVSAGQVQQACGSDYRHSGHIDDLLLFGDVRDLDGPGGVVGMAGACLLRSDGFPLVGIIVLDRADIEFLAASGDLHTVVQHELGHVLDLSMSGWQRRGLLAHDRHDCFDSRTVHFTGGSAAHEFAELGGSGQVPVEDNGVPGTACSHWDEETFHSELMTGYLDRDARLSRITAGALGDMGYRVDLDAADPYSLPSEGELRPQGAGLAITERLLPVGGVLEEDGELRLLPEEVPFDVDLRLPHR